MVQQEYIEKIVSDVLTDEYYIIDVSVNKSNVIEVVIDGDKGVTIQKCVEISRHIEEVLDRETDDFELSVFSAGLGNPFRVYRQYLKNIGEAVEVKLTGKNPVKGIIKNVDENGFDLETKILVKEEGKNKKVEVVKLVQFNFNDQPEVRNSITFK
jgi:ribosome maturation factor RimP